MLNFTNSTVVSTIYYLLSHIFIILNTVPIQVVQDIYLLHHLQKLCLLIDYSDYYEIIKFNIRINH